MVATAKEVGKNRYRESYGRYLEDFNIGDIYEHRPVSYTHLTLPTTR